MTDLKFLLGPVDYVFLTTMLLLSVMIGVYFAVRHKIRKRKKESLNDYLTGGKKLKAFPVAMSLIASYISGVTMLGTPAEIYNYGAQYWLIVVALSLSGVTVAFVYLPVFTKLEVCSSYEYLELRFNKILRLTASCFFIFDELMFLPMLIYVPSMAFSQVSGINLHIVGIVICSVCVLYTILGGLKAVVYTDTWQTVIMFLSDFVVIIVGIIAVGGFGVIYDRAVVGDRLQHIDFTLSMYKHYSFLSILIGGFTYWTSFNAVNQTMVQRYLSLPNDREAKISVAIFTFGVVFFISMCCFAGLLLYGFYYDCDPLTSERISKSDQLLPLFVVEIAERLQGIPGLFMAGLFGAALSSLSVVLNSSAIVLLEDFMRGVCHIPLTELRATLISKCIILILGIEACAMVLLIERLGGIFEVATRLTAVTSGTMFGVFSLGMLVPWSNSKGALAGMLTGFIISCVVAFGGQYALSFNLVVPHKLQFTVDSCLRRYNISVPKPEEPVYRDESDVFPLFRLDYLWVSPIGFFSVLLVGVLVSFATGKTDLTTLDPDVISPVAKWILPKTADVYLGTAVKKIANQRLLETFARRSSDDIGIERPTTT